MIETLQDPAEFKNCFFRKKNGKEGKKRGVHEL
jgi:hypothetical protein